ncbi:MAG: hypothetical protein JWM52_309 [Candidatus Saccharibacteria bacterium]|nr:hypothetical protein [Candidatus Saccharibacteria bacterium]
MKKMLKLVKKYGGIIGVFMGLAGFIMGGTALFLSIKSEGIINNSAQSYISQYVNKNAANLKGERGDKGFQGSVGLTGSMGLQGPQGSIDPQGPVGLTGSSGKSYSPPYDMLCGSFTGRVYQCSSFSTIGTISSDALCASYSKAVTKCGGYFTIGTLN